MNIVLKVIKLYEEKLQEIINPDGIDLWKDVGEDKQPKGYDNVSQWIEDNEDFDEGQQTEIRLYKEFIEVLKVLNEPNTLYDKFNIPIIEGSKVTIKGNVCWVEKNDNGELTCYISGKYELIKDFNKKDIEVIVSIFPV